MMRQEIIQQEQQINGSFWQKSAGLSLVITSSVLIYYCANVWEMRPLATAANAAPIGTGRIFFNSAVTYIFNNRLGWSITMADEVLPAGFGSLVLNATLLIIISQIVLQIVLVIGAGSAPAKTEHEQAALIRGRWMWGITMLLGLVAAVVTLILTGFSIFWMTNVAFLALGLAEILKCTVQLFSSGSDS